MKKALLAMMFLLFSIEVSFCVSPPSGRQKFENGFNLHINDIYSSNSTVIILKDATDKTDLCTIVPDKDISDAEEVGVWDATVSKAGHVAVVAHAGKGDVTTCLIMIYDKNGKLLSTRKSKYEDGSDAVFALAYDSDNTIWALSKGNSKLPAGAKVLYHLNEGGDNLGEFYRRESVTELVKGIRSTSPKGVFSFGLTSKYIYAFDPEEGRLVVMGKDGNSIRKVAIWTRDLPDVFNNIANASYLDSNIFKPIWGVWLNNDDEIYIEMTFTDVNSPIPNNPASKRNWLKQMVYKKSLNNLAGPWTRVSENKNEYAAKFVGFDAANKPIIVEFDQSRLILSDNELAARKKK
jgi:hypothetical protein